MQNLTRRMTLAAAFVVMIGVSTSAKAGPIVVNGSFEMDPWTLTNGVSPTGWTTVLDPGGRFPIGYNNSVGNGSTQFHTPFGQQFIVLGAIDDNAFDSIQQTVSGFTVGDTYTLGFDQSPELAQSQFAYNIGVTISDGMNSTLTPFRVVSNDGSQWAHWFHHDVTFTATNVSETLTFRGIATDTGELVAVESGLDNITLNGSRGPSTPEPATLGLVGIALVGLGARSYRKRHTAA